MRKSELSVHDIAGFLGMSLEMLDRVYGKHRVHHQQGIDDAITKGGIGKTKRDETDGEDFSYGKIAPGDTGRNNSNKAKPTQIKMSERAQKLGKKLLVAAE